LALSGKFGKRRRFALFLFFVNISDKCFRPVKFNSETPGERKPSVVANQRLLNARTAESQFAVTAERSAASNHFAIIALTTTRHILACGKPPVRRSSQHDPAKMPRKTCPMNDDAAPAEDFECYRLIVTQTKGF
jgi:hypothetical protein